MKIADGSNPNLEPLRLPEQTAMQNYMKTHKKNE